MVEEPLLREGVNNSCNVNHHHNNHDFTATTTTTITATAPPRSSLRGKAKQQTRRLSLGLFVGNSDVGSGGSEGKRGKEEKEGLTLEANKPNSSSNSSSSSSGTPHYSSNDFADSAHAGILRCGRGGGDGLGESGLGFEAESDAELRASTGNTSAVTAGFCV